MKKIVKEIISIFILLLVSINTYAVTVGGNDGSAFITKAEFDSLKSNFQSQIDTYNKNIDSKIDNAIAAYLSGISISKEYILKLPTSILKYPIAIYNYENKYTVADFSTLTGDTKWWGPDLQLWMAYGWAQDISATAGAGHQDSHFDVLKAKYVRGTKNKINDFVNIESYNSTTGKAKVSGMTKNLKCTNVITSLEHTKNAWNPQDKDYGYILREDQSDRTNWVGVYSGTFGNIYANGAQLNKTNVVFNTLLIPYIIIRGALPTYTGTGDALYEKFTTPKTPANSVWNNGPEKAVLQGWNKNVINNTFNFVSEISQIYTGYKKSGKEELIPVSYDNIVYYENYKHYKQDLYSYFTDKQSYSIKDNKNDSTNYVPKISSYIDNGWTLNPEGSTDINDAATRPWYQRSLINLSHLYYEVKLPYSGTVSNQMMTEGLIACELEKDVKVINIEIETEFENTTNKKYLAFSKDPITEFDPASISGAKFLKIYDNQDLTIGGVEKKEIVAGKKSYYIDAENSGVKKGDKVYFKILWGPDDNSYVKIKSQPFVKVIAE